MENECKPCGQSNYIVKGKNSQCENPIIYLLNELLLSNELAPAYNSLLNGGLNLTNKGNLCCPDCVNENGFYFIGNLEAWDTFKINYKDSELHTEKFNCCVNYAGNIDNSSSFVKDFSELWVNDIICCSNDFSKLVKTLTPEFFSYVLEEGIIEISLLGGVSFITALFQFLSENNYDESDVSEALKIILKIGVFVKCTDCGILISSAANQIADSRNPN